MPNFSLAGSLLRRKHSLATFVYEQLEWTVVDQSPEQLDNEWLCVDVAGYKIINVYKPPPSRLTNCHPDPGRGSDWGERPHKTYESNFHHNFVHYKSEKTFAI